MKEEIVVFTRCLSKYGLLRGLVLYFKLKIFRFETIQVPRLKHPVFLRRNTSDLVVFEQVFLLDIYDFKMPFTPATIIDCGANIGLATVFFANRFPDARIIAIEPEKSNFEILKRNTASYANVELVKKAIWHENSSLELVDPGVGHHGFTTMEAAKVQSETVEAVPICDIMDKYGLNSIDLLKVDIEGAELELFAFNIDGWLPKTRCMTIELHDFREGASRAFVRAIGKYNFSLTAFGEGYLCFRD